jgi:hypothetical protein
MPTSESDILSAFKILHDAPEEIIKAHRDVALQTLEQLRVTLTANLNGEMGTATDPSTESSRQHNPTQPSDTVFYSQRPDHRRHPSTSRENEIHASATAALANNRDLYLEAANQPTQESGSTGSMQSHTCNQSHSSIGQRPNASRKRKRAQPKPSGPVRLVQALREHAPDFVQFCRTKPSLQNMLQPDDVCKALDLRVDHIKRVDGNKTPSAQERLLKGMCQISLAQQYLNWEAERGFPSRMRDLRARTSTSSDPKGQRGGKISQYIRDAGYEFSDHHTVNKAICRGTVQVLFKSLLEEGLKPSGHQCLVEGILSGVAIFEPFLFQTLKINELPRVVDLLVQSLDLHATATTLEEKEAASRFLHFLEAIDAWSEEEQSSFHILCTKEQQERLSDDSSTLQPGGKSRVHFFSTPNPRYLSQCVRNQLTTADTVVSLSRERSSMDTGAQHQIEQQSQTTTDMAPQIHNILNDSAGQVGSFPLQPDELFLQCRSHPEMSVLDPSSHVAGIDLPFLNGTEDLNASSEANRAQDAFQSFSSLDPSSHVQNVNFTLLNPAEHVRTLHFPPLGELCPNRLPAADSIPRSSGDYISNSSADGSSRIPADGVQLGYLSGHASNSHMNRLGYSYTSPRFETRPHQMESQDISDTLSHPQPISSQPNYHTPAIIASA